MFVDGVLMAYAEGVIILGVRGFKIGMPFVVKIGVPCVIKIGVPCAGKIGVPSLIVEVIVEVVVKVIGEKTFPGHILGVVLVTVRDDSLVEVEVTAPGHDFGIVILSFESLVDIQGSNLELFSPHIEVALSGGGIPYCEYSLEY